MSSKPLLFLVVVVGSLLFVCARLGSSQVGPPPAAPTPAPVVPLPPPDLFGQAPAQPPIPIAPPLARDEAFAPGIPQPPAASKSQAKKLSSLWSLQMEQIEGRNIIRATIGKKNDVRIECDNMAYQTPEGTLTALGNVTISGPGIQGRCATLVIVLSDDRLILEGKAKVTILKYTGKSKPYAETPDGTLADLDGDRLSLRLPDLQAKESLVPYPKYDDKKADDKK